MVLGLGVWDSGAFNYSEIPDKRNTVTYSACIMHGFWLVLGDGIPPQSVTTWQAFFCFSPRPVTATYLRTINIYKQPKSRESTGQQRSSYQSELVSACFINELRAVLVLHRSIDYLLVLDVSCVLMAATRGGRTSNLQRVPVIQARMHRISCHSTMR